MTVLPRKARAALVLICVATLSLIAAACAGGGGDQEAAAEVTGVVVNSELVVGENRFMVGLLSQENEEITGGEADFRLYKLDGAQRDLRAEARATSITLQKFYSHTHEDGTLETHDAGESGVYVAAVRFDEAGPWSVEVSASVGGEPFETDAVPFTVDQESSSIPVGAPAPRSDTLTLDDVADIPEIDTSDPPIPGMHTLSIAEAVTSGRPTVIVFATPSFCVSRICGPTKEVVDDLYSEYDEGVNFVHVEPYDLDRARSGEGLFPIPATAEWGLRSEPWVFVVDREGNVAAKFEAFVTLDELQDALNPLLNGY